MARAVRARRTGRSGWTAVAPESAGAGAMALTDRRPAMAAQRALIQTMRAGRAAPVTQAKAGLVPTQENLLARARGADAFISDAEPYVAVVFAIYDYQKLANDNDYAQQIIALKKIERAIAGWEAVHGSVEQTTNFARMAALFETNKQRRVLKDLKASIASEDRAVRLQAQAAADAEQLKDRAVLETAVRNGLAQGQDRLLHNSCDWILNARKTALYAVTPTGDSPLRLAAVGRDPDKYQALFPKADIGSAGAIGASAASYNALDFTDNGNVDVNQKAGILGWNFAGPPGAIAVVRPSAHRESELQETIKHEVQHDADRHKGRDSLAAVRRASEAFDKQIFLNFAKSTLGMAVPAEATADAEYALSRYKTEFRAYWYEDTRPTSRRGRLDARPGAALYEGYAFSERQKDIFLHILGGYGYVKEAWEKNDLLADGRTTFRDAISAYADPDKEGFNKLNSARIDDLYAALDAVGGRQPTTFLELNGEFDAAPVAARETNPRSPAVVAVLKAIDALGHAEARYILRSGAAMRAKLKAHLAGAASRAVLRRLKAR